MSLQLSGDSGAPIHDSGSGPFVPAGARLRDARMAAGLSIDAVAQQLKLAPRQVVALEDDDYALLPGRTFVRGFMRNYARLVRLDPEAVLASLPEAGVAPSLDRPSITPTTRVMGEMPADLTGKSTSARWAIPLALIAIVAIAVFYEFGRPLAEYGKARTTDKNVTLVSAPSVPSAPVSGAPSATDATPTAPSNPQAAAGDQVAGSVTGSEPVTPRTETVAAPSAPAADMPLTFVFRGTSWIEVKDGKGAVVLSTIGYPGATHAVGGTAPFEVVLGNAEAVTVTWRGTPFDSTPFVKQNVAKFSIK
jgi:cytoskeleton protein RodZ